MVSPERKRQAVLRFQERLSVSERRACRLIAQPRATRRYRGVRLDQDAPLVAALRRVSTSRPRAGYRMAAAYLRREGWTLNDKGAQRFWRQEGIKVPRRQRKLRRLGSSENSAQRLRATRVNEVWSYDFVFDQTEDGRRLKWLPICDEFSRESVALEVERRMESADVIRILDAAVAERGTAPEFIRSDNGPEFIAAAVQAWIRARGFKTLYIAPGSPWENPYSESFKLPLSGRVPELGKLRLPAGSQSARQGAPARLQPRTTALLAGILTPRRSLRPPHRPNHHQPKPRKSTKFLIASGSNFGGRPQSNACV